MTVKRKCQTAEFKAKKWNKYGDIFFDYYRNFLIAQV
jgi:hypothetical protein